MKRIRTTSLLAAVAVAAGAATTVPAAADAAKPRCADRAGTTYLQEPGRRVYATRTKVKGDPDASTLRLYACKPTSRKSPKLLDKRASNLDALISIEDVDAAGPNKVWVELDEATGVSDTRVLALYDTKTGADLASYAQEFTGPLTKGIATDGALVVQEEAGRLLAFDGAGARVLAPAGATDLAVGGQRAYWVSGGVVGSALLAGAPSGDLTAP